MLYIQYENIAYTVYIYFGLHTFMVL